jgi:hypothetical protein
MISEYAAPYGAYVCDSGIYKYAAPTGAAKCVALLTVFEISSKRLRMVPSGETPDRATETVAFPGKEFSEYVAPYGAYVCDSGIYKYAAPTALQRASPTGHKYGQGSAERRPTARPVARRWNADFLQCCRAYGATKRVALLAVFEVSPKG